MWFTGFTIVSTVFLASNALPTLVQFRSPSFVDPAPVSLFYADEYLLDARASARFVYIPALLREQPCLLMEPAYSFVRDHMALYGTCDYQDVFRLDLQRSGEQWTAKVKRTNQDCREDLVEDFDLSWQGIKRTVVSNKQIKVGAPAVLDLLPYKKGMSFEMVQSLYPVLNITNITLSNEKKQCQCFNASELDLKSIWSQRCPEESFHRTISNFFNKVQNIFVSW